MEEPQDSKKPNPRLFGDLILEQMMKNLEGDIFWRNGLTSRTEFLGRGLITLPTLEPDGRDRPFDYKDTIEAEEIVDDILDAEEVFRMKDAPSDPLDEELQLERHVAECSICRDNYTEVCAHCLEPRVCKEVPLTVRMTMDKFLNSPELPPKRTLKLCRPCRNSARDGVLALD